MTPLIHPAAWTAPRKGQDWTCPDTERAVAWFRSFADTKRLDARLDACRTYYERNREAVEDGLGTSLFDPRDSVAWYILQADTYATDRRFWTPHESARIVPYIQRIGQLLDRLAKVQGVEERVERLINGSPSQPDGPLFELLVAGAWADRGYTVRFVPERRGIARTPDLEVKQGRSSWAVETKRMMPSTYARKEEETGRRIAARLHDLSEASGHSFVVDVLYKNELSDYSENFLAECVRDLLPVHEPKQIDVDSAILTVRPVNWTLCSAVFDKDFVFIGSSRMMELINGRHNHDLSHSLRAKCRRAPNLPSYADHIYHASLVNWTCCSHAANIAKAKHFKKKLADAEGQLLMDRPGVIHIGMESSGRPEADTLRHFLNGREALEFTTKRSRLRWVYGNYFKTEVTTRQNESAAMEETVAVYKVGQHRTRNPLRHRLLLSDDNNITHWGAYWDPSYRSN